jgi:hypothetical protein
LLALVESGELSSKDEARAREVLAEDSEQVEELEEEALDDVMNVPSKEELEDMLAADMKMSDEQKQSFRDMFAGVAGDAATDSDVTASDSEAEAPKLVGMDDDMDSEDEKVVEDINEEEIQEMIASGEYTPEQIADLRSYLAGDDESEGSFDGEQVQEMIDSGDFTADQVEQLKEYLSSKGQIGDSRMRVRLDPKKTTLMVKRGASSLTRPRCKR